MVLDQQKLHSGSMEMAKTRAEFCGGTDEEPVPHVMNAAHNDNELLFVHWELESCFNSVTGWRLTVS